MATNSSNGNPYVSSIVHKYGDPERVETDATVIADILDRQGNWFLIDLIAERVGLTANKFKLAAPDRERLRTTLTDLDSALSERL